MKGVLAVILLIAVLAGAGYYGFPILMEKQTSGMRSEIQLLKEKVQKIEDFVKSEQEARKLTQLGPDADAQKIIKSVNTVSSRLVTLEESVKKQSSTAEQEMKKLAEIDTKNYQDTQTRIQKIMFDSAMANIRGHVLKARVDLVAKNIGTARTELDLITDAFENVKKSSTEENKKIIDELQSTVKKARAEIDTDLPAALNKIDLLWHEMSKLLKKI